MDDLEAEALRKKLEELDREKQQIISLVSHDIKAPLNRVFALVQLMHLEDENLTPDQHSYLDKMHLVVADGLGLIRNLVDYRNLEYRKSEILIEKVNLSQVTQLVIKNFQTVAGKKKIAIEFDLPNELFSHSDHYSIIRIIENLISNAVKFSGENKIITIRAGEREDSVFLSIQDQAVGFKEGDLQKMYRKFQKLSALPTGGESATGLGLFIVKAMTDRIQGEIVCTTNEGLGSTFTLTVPKTITV